MSEKFKNQIMLIARILMAMLFLLSGITKIADFAGTVGYISSKGLPLPQFVAVIAIVVELGGSLVLLAGFKTRMVTFVMALFTLVASVLFHNFWSLPADQVLVNQIMFLKNLSITGGLLMFVAFGAGGLSLDAKRES
jgi:putative oxidoreductase